MKETIKYKGYLIELCLDGTYDVMKDTTLVESDFKSIDEAKKYIDT